MTSISISTRGQIWFDALTQHAVAEASGPIRTGDAALAGEPARFIAVVPDPSNRFRRATDNGRSSLSSM